MRIEIPYHKTVLKYEIPETHTMELLRPEHAENKWSDTQMAAVEEALADPIGTEKLSELAKGKQKITIICSDHTRPVPSKYMIPPMLREIRKGNPDAEIVLLIATGMHRPTTREELVDKFGEGIVEQETIVIHKCREDENLKEIGILPSGAPLVINRYAADADLLVSEGFIEPHFFAGFSGGRKSVLPGVCGYRTVLGNHCAGFIASEHARTGILEGNPIHRDMIAAAELAKLAFIVNVVLDEEKKIQKAVAGHPVEAHAAGVAFLKEICRVSPEKKGDIVSTSNGGAPLDQNLYQAVKGMTAAEAAAADGGVVIMCSGCVDGAGGDDFYEMFHTCESPQALYEDIMKRAQSETEPDQWEAQILARVLCKYRVILICEPEAKEIAEGMRIETADSLEEAMCMAEQDKGKDAHVVVIPDGVSVVVNG